MRLSALCFVLATEYFSWPSFYFCHSKFLAMQVDHHRRHLAASPLFKGIPNFRDTRIAMLRAETKEDLYRIFDKIEPML